MIVLKMPITESLTRIKLNTAWKVFPYLEIFWSVFSRIKTQYREISRIFLYSVRTQENTEQSNSEYEQAEGLKFLCKLFFAKVMEIRLEKFKFQKQRNDIVNTRYILKQIFF